MTISADRTIGRDTTIDHDGLRARVREFVASHDPGALEPLEYLRARYDAGLAWVANPEGYGGLGLSRDWQAEVDEAFDVAGAPRINPDGSLGIALGMAAPTILAFGTEEQKQRFIRPIWTGETIWCQLFSEPGAGSDLANVSTRAVRDGDGWVVNGQKVWTSVAHLARYAILVARTDPDAPKHKGLTYFLVDMTDPGIDVRPLRQITGEAEFNEVFLTDVRIPDENRLGEIGQGWIVAMTTLGNERVAIGSHAAPRESGMIGVVAQTWREHPELHTPELQDRLMRLWVTSEAARLAGQRLRQKLAAGQPGPEGAAMKLVFADLNQELSGLELEILGEDGLRYDDWTMVRPERVDFYGRDAGFRYLRAKGNSIEGGTSEVLRNVVAERVLGLPTEPRVDKDLPWKDLEK